jgi:glycosyltransferase involved in cell wall biosynthesis
VGFTPIRSLDLYRDPDPFRMPAPSEFTSFADVAEFAVMLTAGFGEPLAYSMRIAKVLKDRRGDFDIVHDDQCIGPGILQLHRRGWPVLETLHHPITVDRSIALDHADTPGKRLATKRWFGFLRMQVRVVKQLPAVLTVSHNSKADIHDQMGVALERLTVVPVGVDHEVFKPYDDVVKKKGRLMVTSSSDVPMKGLVPLLEAIAKLRVERDVDLIVIGQPRPKGRVALALERFGLTDIVTTISGVSDEELARLYGEAEVAIVPSLYEGFSLPAIEAMSCEVPVVATTGGALPEVVGRSGETGMLVQPNNPEALVDAIRQLLDDAALRERLGRNGRRRVMERFTWQVTARGTAACYDAILDGRPLPDSVIFD